MIEFPPAFFVTGTDTGVGKTVVSAIVTLGLRAAYWKPVQSGLREETDTEFVRRVTGLPADHFFNERFRLTQPLSPHASAAIDGVRIELEDFVLPTTSKTHLVVEGAGGLLVPLNDRALVIDLIAHLGLPVLLVARSSLGTINHTTLSVEALRSRGIELLGVVMNGKRNESNRRAIEHYCRTRVIAEIPPLGTDLTREVLADVARSLGLQSEEADAAAAREARAHLFGLADLGQGRIDSQGIESASDAAIRKGRQYPIWHPFTQMKTAGQPLRVRSAEGARLHLDDGRTLIDCISSWWVTLHGHAQPQIADAIADQAHKLEQVIFAGFTHEPAERLAHLLLERLPPTLTRVFFSDNGSTSVEVALKMCWQYWQNIGQPQRTRFIGFEGGYHGDTIGAMSAGGSSTFWRPFKKLMFDIDVAPFPATWEGDSEVQQRESECLAVLERLLEQHSGHIAGIVIEPLVQGAAGMRMCRPDFLRELRARANEHDVLLVFDEVMTGFGRTGDWFACTKSGVTPDIICLSKGITGGFLPLSVTVASENIYQAFYADELERALFHSHSYTANPIACAAAVASMGVLEENTTAFRTMEATHRALAQRHLASDGLFERARFCGTIAAFDIAGAQADYYSFLPAQLRREFIEEGLLLRPLGNTIYLMPPLCCDEALLDSVYSRIASRVQLTCTSLAM